MPKKKLVFQPKSYYKYMIEDYIFDNKAKIIKHTLQQMGYDDVDTLLDDEYHSKWGFDCGWYLLTPKNEDMRKEWTKYDDWDSFICPIALKVQSTTIQKYQVEFILEELKLNDVFYANCHLD